jgi:hypothetical protein
MTSRPLLASLRNPLAVIEPSGYARDAATLRRSGSSGPTWSRARRVLFKTLRLQWSFHLRRGISRRTAAPEFAERHLPLVEIQVRSCRAPAPRAPKAPMRATFGWPVVSLEQTEYIRIRIFWSSLKFVSEYLFSVKSPNLGIYAETSDDNANNLWDFLGGNATCRGC